MVEIKTKRWVGLECETEIVTWMETNLLNLSAGGLGQKCKRLSLDKRDTNRDRDGISRRG